MKQEILRRITQADAIVIGAGAGLSEAAGLHYAGPRFQDNMVDFIERYGMTDMYSAGFYPFSAEEEKWAYWSRHVSMNRYEPGATPLYTTLAGLMQGKNYHVITTNVDHQFWLGGFEDERIFATQGDYGLFQCKKGCHKTLYSNEETIKSMIHKQVDCRIPSSLVPVCPVCGGPMEMHLRSDGYFVQNEEWEMRANRYRVFLEKYQNQNILFLELGVGMNTPGIIKYPFWQMTASFPNAFLISINRDSPWIPTDIEQKALAIGADINSIFHDLEERI